MRYDIYIHIYIYIYVIRRLKVNLRNEIRETSHSPAAFDFSYTHTVELHLSGLIGTASHPDV